MAEESSQAGASGEIEAGTGAVAAPEAAPDAAAEQAGSIVERGLEFFQAGGPVVMILLVMSVAALTIVIVKLRQFRAARVDTTNPSEEALALYRAGDAKRALAIAEASPDPVSRTLALAIRGRARRDLDDRQVREEAVRFGGDLLEGLRSYMRPLEFVGSTAPLLGLFGTVLGMIEAFRQMEGAGSRVDPSVLSGGIWEALLTTAVGLAVAIPVVAVQQWFERRVERAAHRMDSIVTRVFTPDLAQTHTVDTDHEPASLRAAAAGE